MNSEKIDGLTPSLSKAESDEIVRLILSTLKLKNVSARK